MRRRFLWLITNTLNRWTTRLARAGRGPFSLVRHVGRTSGKQYETPIIVAPAEGGFIAELTYGENVDWYRKSSRRADANSSCADDRIGWWGSSRIRRRPGGGRSGCRRGGCSRCCGGTSSGCCARKVERVLVSRRRRRRLLNQRDDPGDLGP
jgi:hypothetical protein